MNVEAGLLTQLAPDGVVWVLGLADKAAGEVPVALVRWARTARQQHSSLIVLDDRARSHLRVGVVAEAAPRALDLPLVLVVLEIGAALWAPAPRLGSPTSGRIVR